MFPVVPSQTYWAFFLYVSFLSLYVALYACHYFNHEGSRSLDVGFIKIPNPRSIRGSTNKHLHIMLNGLDGCLIKVGEILSQRFSGAFANVEREVVDILLF